MNPTEVEKLASAKNEAMTRLGEYIEAGSQILRNMRAEEDNDTVEDCVSTNDVMNWRIVVSDYLANLVGKDHEAYSVFYAAARGAEPARIQMAIGALKGLRTIIKQRGICNESHSTPPAATAAVEHLCERFFSVACAMRNRRDNREPLLIRDEYDVQYLLHALLTAQFDDVRPEAWTPPYAGGSARMDFVLKQEQIVIEVKKTRTSMSPSSLGSELLVDIARYQECADCRTLICFVYDPDGLIGNARGIESDLESQGAKTGLPVRVFIRPK